MPSRSWTSTPRSFCPTDPPEVTDVPDDFPRPAADDEGQHPPGEEELWNESWYFDAVAEDGSLGVYARIGLYPNLGVAWYTAYVTGPDRPAVAVVNLEAPP